MKKNSNGKKLKYGCNKTQFSLPHFLKWLTFKSYNCILCQPWFAFHLLSLEYIPLKWILWAKDGLYWQFGLKRMSDKTPNCDFISAPKVVSTRLSSRRCPELKDLNARWFWFNFVAAPMALSPACLAAIFWISWCQFPGRARLQQQSTSKYQLATFWTNKLKIGGHIW